MQTSDFTYDLPEELIAQEPLVDRAAARLLVLRRATGQITHQRVDALPELLRSGDLVVVNDTRVLPVRLQVRRETGGQGEVLLLHPLGKAPDGAPSAGVEWTALVRPARRLRPGEALRLPPGGEGLPVVRLVRQLGDGEAVVRFEGAGSEDVPSLLRRIGQVPLPPYIRRPLADPERYQTVYARREGSAAAPTAGLHFTPELLQRLEAAGVARAAVTLHVGLGTFRPVTATRPQEHRLHAEWISVEEAAAQAVAEARARQARVVAVGTTVVRTLESQALPGGLVRPGGRWTDLYILPGSTFRVVDALLTNFHLPRSTLLMMVCAFGGQEAVLAAYREAVRLRYRFFSFGDAMLIL